jgi:hypothetical protein
MQMPGFIYFLPVFIGMFVLVTYLISKMGWVTLAEKFRTDLPFEGTKIGTISATINAGNYRNAIKLKYDYQGFYLKTVFFFRLFHPPVFIPWTEIKQVRNKKILFTQQKELVIGEPFVAMITISESVFNKIKDHIKPSALERRQ